MSAQESLSRLLERTTRLLPGGGPRVEKSLFQIREERDGWVSDHGSSALTEGEWNNRTSRRLLKNPRLDQLERTIGDLGQSMQTDQNNKKDHPNFLPLSTGSTSCTNVPDLVQNLRSTIIESAEDAQRETFQSSHCKGRRRQRREWHQIRQIIIGQVDAGTDDIRGIRSAVLGITNGKMLNFSNQTSLLKPEWTQREMEIADLLAQVSSTTESECQRRESAFTAPPSGKGIFQDAEMMSPKRAPNFSLDGVREKYFKVSELSMDLATVALSREQREDVADVWDLVRVLVGWRQDLPTRTFFFFTREYNDKLFVVQIILENYP